MLIFIKNFLKNILKFSIFSLLLVICYHSILENYYLTFTEKISQNSTNSCYSSKKYLYNFVNFFENIQDFVKKIPTIRSIFIKNYNLRILSYGDTLLKLFQFFLFFIFFKLKLRYFKFKLKIITILVFRFVFFFIFKFYNIFYYLNTVKFLFLVKIIFFTVYYFFFNYSKVFINFFYFLFFKKFKIIALFLFYKNILKNLKFKFNLYFNLKVFNFFFIFNFFIIFFKNIKKIVLIFFNLFLKILKFVTKKFFFILLFLFKLENNLLFVVLFKKLILGFFIIFKKFKNFILFAKNLSYFFIFLLIFFFKKIKQHNLIFLVYFFKKIGLPFRIFIRFINLLFCFTRALTLLVLYDSLLVFKHTWVIVTNFYFLEIAKRGIFYFWIIAYLINYDKISIGLTILGVNLFDSFFINFTFNLVESWSQPIIISIFFLFILSEITSIYYTAASAKFIHYSICYLFLYLLFIIIYLIPEYSTALCFIYKGGGFFILFLYTFRALREDYRLKIPINGYLLDNHSFTAQIQKHHSVVFKIFNKTLNVYIEHFLLYIYIATISTLLFDLRDSFYYTNSYSWVLGDISNFQIYLVVGYLALRQSTYAYSLWLLIFSYYVFWNVISVILLSTTNYAYLGILSQSSINETNALGNTGLLSTISGLEQTILGSENANIAWYFGENFYKNTTTASKLSKNDNIFMTNTPFNPFGDMFINPYIFTASDDHNWVIFETLEKNYFNLVKLEKSNSNSSSGDTEKFWPIERNLYIWFGEFVETDIYYGWSSFVNIDTQTYFDYSPYALTNILGDSFMRSLLTDIFSIFSGPVELDESTLLNNSEWGSNYVPGSTTNRISGGMSSGLENTATLNLEQKLRENGESYHEWFPGLYVLDGRFDSKFSYFYLNLFLFLVFPLALLSTWLTILGKKSNFFDESFGELEFTNHNFYFFGNEQSQTFTTYFWNDVYNSNFEWPTDELPVDPVAYEPASNLFEEIFRHFQSGLFNHSVLDSYFFIPILKHTEGFSSESYKDFLMPLLFPTNVDSKSARIEDFNKFYENFKKIKNSTKNYKTRELNREFIDSYTNWNRGLKSVNIGIQTLADSWAGSALKTKPNMSLKYGYGDVINFTTLGGLKSLKNMQNMGILGKLWLNRKFSIKVKNNNKINNLFNNTDSARFFNNLKIRKSLKLRSKSYKYLKKYNNFNNSSTVLIDDKSFDIKDLIFRLEKDPHSSDPASYRESKTKLKDISGYYPKELEESLADSEYDTDPPSNDDKEFAKYRNRLFDVSGSGWLNSNSFSNFKKVKSLSKLKAVSENYWHPSYENSTHNNKTKFENLNSTVDDIDLDLHAINIDGTPILANEVAYEHNIEYSNLFESIILELISPDGQRHLDLEYEFLSSEPEFSTISEFADPEGNFNESGIFENDTIIDDPRTEMISEWEDSVENMDNILSFFLNEIQDRFWEDIPDEYQLFGINPENTNLQDNNIFKKKNNKNYTQDVVSQGLGVLDEDSIGYGPGLIGSAELIGASPNPDKNYEFENSDISDGFFKHFLTTRKILIKSGLKQAIKHKIQSIKYYNVKKINSYMGNFFDEEKNSIIEIKERLSRLQYIVTSYIKYKYENDLFNSKTLNKKIYYLYEKKRQKSLKIPEHIVGYLGNYGISNKFTSKVYLKKFKLQKMFSLFLIKKISSSFLNFIKYKKVNKVKTLKWFNFKYFKTVKFIFKNLEYSKKFLLINSKFFFNFFKINSNVVTKNLKNIFILWKHFLNLYKVYLKCKKNLLVGSFSSLKNNSTTNRQFKTFLGRNNNYFYFLKIKSILPFRRLMSNKKINHILIKKSKTNRLNFYKKINIFSKNLKIILKKNTILLKTEIISHFKYFKKYKKTIKFGRLLLFKFKLLNILNTKKIFLTNRNLFFYKNKYNVSVTGGSNCFYKKDVIVRVLYKLCLVILKNKLKKNIFLKLWYNNLHNITHLVVELLKFNILALGGKFEIFFNFYKYFINTVIVEKKHNFINTFSYDIVYPNLIYNKYLIYFLISKIFFSNVINCMYAGVSSFKFLEYFLIVNISYLLKFLPKKIKYFKIFKINYKFLEIKKLKPVILKKLITIKNKFGNFIPYSYSSILIKINNVDKNTENSHIQGIKLYFNFYKVVKLFKYSLRVFNLFRVLLKSISIFKNSFNRYFYFYIERVEFGNLNSLFFCISKLILKPTFLYFSNFNSKINMISRGNLIYNHKYHKYGQGLLKKQLKVDKITRSGGIFTSGILKKNKSINIGGFSEIKINVDFNINMKKNNPINLNFDKWYSRERLKLKSKYKVILLADMEKLKNLSNMYTNYSFNLEYSTIWIKELMWSSKQSIYQDPSSKSFYIFKKKLEYCLNGDFYNLVGILPIRLKFRKYLQRKYPQFIYKATTFIVGLNFSEMSYKLNELFFEDVTETFVKFLISKLITFYDFKTTYRAVSRFIKISTASIFENLKQKNMISHIRWDRYVNKNVMFNIKKNWYNFITTANSLLTFYMLNIKLSSTVKSRLSKYIENVSEYSKKDSDFVIMKSKVRFLLKTGWYKNQKFKNLKIWSKFPHIAELRHFWTKTYIKYTIVPRGLVNIKDTVTLIFLKNSIKSTFLNKTSNDDNFSDLKKLIYIFKFKTKLDRSDIWYSKCILTTKTVPASLEFNLKFYKIDEYVFSLNLNKVYKSTIQKIFYLKKFWNLTKNYGNFGKLFLKNMFWFSTNKKKKKNINSFIHNQNSIPNLLYYLNIKKNIKTSLIKNAHRFVYHLDKGNFFLNNLKFFENFIALSLDDYGLSAELLAYSQKYLSYFMFLKIISLLNLGYLQNITLLDKFEKNSELLLYTSFRSKRDTFWVISTYSKLYKILNFKKTKNKNYLDFLDWRSLVINYNFDNFYLKRNNNIFYPILLFNFGILKRHWNAVKIKFYRNNVNFIKKYILKIVSYVYYYWLEPRFIMDSLIFKKNNKNSYLVSLYNAEHTKDFILNTFENEFDHRLLNINHKVFSNRLIIYWKEKKNIIISFRDTIASFSVLPYIKHFPSIFYSFIFIYEKIQPISSEDLAYFLDYSKYFLYKINYFVRLKKINLLLIYKKNLEYLIRIVNLKFICRFDWYKLKKIYFSNIKDKLKSLNSKRILKNKNKYQLLLKNKILFTKKNTEISFSENFNVNSLKNNYENIINESINYDIADQDWAELEKDVQPLAGTSESSMTGFTNFIFSESFWKKRFIEYTSVKYLNMMHDEFSISSKGNPFYFENQIHTLRSFGYNIPIFQNDKLSATLANGYHSRILYIDDDSVFGQDSQHMQDDWTEKDRLIFKIEKGRETRGNRKNRFLQNYKFKIINKKYMYKKHSNIRLVKLKKKKKLFRKYRFEIDSYSKRRVRKKDGYRTYYKKKRIKKRYIYYSKKKRLMKTLYWNLIRSVKRKKNEIVIFNKDLLNIPDYTVDKALAMKKLQKYFQKNLKIEKNKNWRFLDKFNIFSIKKPEILNIEKIKKKTSLVVLNKKNKAVGMYLDKYASFPYFEKLLTLLYSKHFRNLIIFNNFSWFNLNKYKNHKIKNYNIFNKKFGEFLSITLDYDQKFWKTYYNFVEPVSRNVKMFNVVENSLGGGSRITFKNYWKFKNYNILKNENTTNLIYSFLNYKNIENINYFLKKIYKITGLRSKFLINNLLHFKKYNKSLIRDADCNTNSDKISKLALTNTLAMLYDFRSQLTDVGNTNSFFYSKNNSYEARKHQPNNNQLFLYTTKIRNSTRLPAKKDPTFVLADDDQKHLRDLLVLSGIEGFNYSWLDNKFDKRKYHLSMGTKSANRQRSWLVFLKYRYSRVFKYFLKTAVKKRKNIWKTDGNLILKVGGSINKTYFRKNRKWYKFPNYKRSKNNKYVDLYLVEEEIPHILDDFDLTLDADYTVSNRIWNFSDMFGLKFNYYLEMPMSTAPKSKVYISKIQNQFFDSPVLTKEMIFRIFPFFLEGGWSGSDSGQTAVGSNSPTVDSKDPEYRVYHPIFGVYLLNFSRLNRDIKQLGWNFTEKLISHETIRRSFFLFVSDHDTQFYDDKVLHIHNFWLFWLEFFRHLFLNRWTLVYNYTNSGVGRNIDIKYPIGFIHDFYWFKYLTFSRFIKKQIELVKMELLYGEAYSKKTLKRKYGDNFKILKSLLFLTLVKNKYFFFYNFKYKNMWYSRKINFLLNFKYLKKFRNLEFVDLLNKKILFKKPKLLANSVMANADNFPNINKYFSSYFNIKNSIIFSKNLSWRHGKVTNPVMTYYKPYNNTEVFDHYNEVLFEFDPEIPMRRFTYNWFVYSDLGVSSHWDYESDSDSNMYKLREYPNRESVSFRHDFANSENRVAPELHFTSSFNWEEDNSLDSKKVVNKLEDLRNSTRKDSNLRLNRNWFFSNHILDTSIAMSAYTGNWLFFSDFEVDSQRTKHRNLKHGSKYRLNFNTELWWARTELPNYNFRRVDGLEYDVDFGALDSDGEIFHLSKGILDLAHLPENLDVFETNLPLFERSLLDPESPALNEDGEFPEFDINVEYNSEVFKRLNFTSKTNIYSHKKESAGWTGEPDLVTTSDSWHTDLEYFSEDYAAINKKNVNNKFLNKKNNQRSFKFRVGSVDWSDSTFTRNLKYEIEHLKKSISIRKHNYNFGSPLHIISDMCNVFDLSIADIGDIVDVISVKTLHPVSYSAEGIFGELIETKLDEAVEYNLLSGIPYSDLFVNYRFFNKYKKLNWYFLDLISETQVNTLENSYGFDFDLLLYKHSSDYWKIILELDSNWNSAYTPSFPQIVDNSNNIDEYLPVWNYDPSLWEYHGFEYDCTPLTIKDDSKMLLNSKIARFDLNLNWIAQRDLKDNGISINNLGWGGTNITEGLANHLPYDLLYGSDVDSDFEIYSELLFFKNLEDNMSDIDSNFSEEFLTSNTSTDEYPQHGWSPERAFNLVSNAYVGNDVNTENFSDNDLKDDVTAENVNGELIANPQFNEGDPTVASLDNLEADDGFSSVNGSQSSFGLFGYREVPLDHNTIPSQLYYNGTTDQLATKYALYGGYGANTPPDDPDFDIEDKEHYADPESSDINLYINTQSNAALLNVGQMVEDAGSQYYIGSETKRWKYIKDDPEINPEYRETDVNSDEMVVSLDTEESQDLNYTSFLALDNSKSLLVTNSVWKSIYYDFLSTYDYQIEDVKLYDKYSPNNTEPYFIDSTLEKLNIGNASTVKSGIISKIDILDFSEKENNLKSTASIVKSFKKFQILLQNLKKNNKISVKSNIHHPKNYKSKSTNYLFLEKLYIQKKLPMFVNFKKYNYSVYFTKNNYFKKYTTSYNLYRSRKTNINIFSKVDFEQSIAIFIKNLKYPNFFYTKLNNKEFFNKHKTSITANKYKLNSILRSFDKNIPLKFKFYKQEFENLIWGHWKLYRIFLKSKISLMPIEMIPKSLKIRKILNKDSISVSVFKWYYTNRSPKKSVQKQLENRGVGGLPIKPFIDFITIRHNKHTTRIPISDFKSIVWKLISSLRFIEKKKKHEYNTWYEYVRYKAVFSKKNTNVWKRRPIWGKKKLQQMYRNRHSFWNCKSRKKILRIGRKARKLKKKKYFNYFLHDDGGIYAPHINDWVASFMGCRNIVVIKPVKIKILSRLTSKYFNKKNKSMFKLKKYKKRYLTNFRLLIDFNKNYLGMRGGVFSTIHTFFKTPSVILKAKNKNSPLSVVSGKNQSRNSKVYFNEFLTVNNRQTGGRLAAEPGSNLRFSDILKNIRNKKYKSFYTNNNTSNTDRVYSTLFAKYKYLKKINITDINNYEKIESYNYSVSNLQLGNKRGGVGDSSHWSSGTEYLGEQFSSAFRPHSDLFGTETNSRRNNRFMYSPELETDHTDHYTGYDTDVNLEIYTGSFEPYKLSSEMSILYKNIMSEKDDHLDEFYDDNSLPGVAFEQFSYIDWGFDSDHDQLNSDQNFLFSEQYTGDMQRDRSSESVYIDFIQNEYARELRQNPEELGDWTVSDFYTEIYFKHEISEIPISTNESELYSIDSSNSISDFILGMGNDSYLDEKTLQISEEDSSEYEDPVFQNYGSSPNYEFNLIDKIQTLLQFDANIKATSAPNTDIFNLTEFISTKPSYGFSDFTERATLGANLVENSYNTEWGDYNKMELEDNSRETLSFFKQQKYLDSFFFEAIVNDVLFSLNYHENLGIPFNFSKLVFNIAKPISFRFVLFNKTNYLKNYRKLMVDLNLSNFMF